MISLCSIPLLTIYFTILVRDVVDISATVRPRAPIPDSPIFCYASCFAPRARLVFVEVGSSLPWILCLHLPTSTFTPHKTLDLVVYEHVRP